MVGERRTVTVGDVCEVFDGPHATPTRTDVGPVFLGISSLERGRLDISKSDRISEEQFAVWTKRILPQGGDVVFSYETRLGEAGFIPDGLVCCLGRRMGLMRVKDKNILDPKYLLYAYLGPAFQQTIAERTYHGSTVDRIPLIEFPQFPIELPSIQEQRQVAHILSALDDKIELNRKSNETLETTAQALFKSWFVYFDPVRAKAEGRPTGLPDDLDHLFPDSFVETDIGAVPSGWLVTTVGALASKIGMGPFGSNIKVETYVDFGVPVINGKNLKGLLVEDRDYNFISIEHADRLENSCVYPGDLVLTHRGTLGQVSMVPDGSRYPRHLASQSQFFIRPVNRNAGLYLLFFLTLEPGRSRLLSNQTQVGVPSIARPSTFVRDLPVVMPPMALLEGFGAVVGPTLSRMKCTRDESETISSIRDTLLPKLISGELHVPEAALDVAGV